MVHILNYQIKEKLNEGTHSIVYRACRRDDNQGVILKVMKQEYPTSEEITYFKREYEVIRALSGTPGVVQAYGLEKVENRFMLILEDFGGESLTRLIQQKHVNPELSELMHLAIQIAKILGEIHSQNVIHKNINPSNIVWNPKTGQVKIIDFGFSARLPGEKEIMRNLNMLEGTLPYMAPEQTGRMNRAIDYRTDFYSFGVSFYEILTGRLPFETTDVLELVHCHIAKIPIPVHEQNSKIPEILSKMISRLMAKNVEERYQSISGIIFDLHKCMVELLSKGRIDCFDIGQQDVFDKFQIPQKLYGRAREMETLLDAFEQASNGTTEIMVVTGYSGIGKTSLVREIHQQLIEKQGYFITGKFDQFKHDIPYTSLIQAFHVLIRQILTESEEKISFWKERLLETLGLNGQVIVNVIPDIELIIGKQPPVEELPPTESQNRFNLVIQNFIRVFAQPNHPLTIFLDDLQWIDSASLKLIRLLVTDPETKFIFFIGAYRDNEVDAAHHLILTLNDIKKAGGNVNSITLQPLNFLSMYQLLADSFRCDIEKTKPLAVQCIQKTGGNPFF
jgi:serine/threonine protein kinase